MSLTFIETVTQEDADGIYWKIERLEDCMIVSRLGKNPNTSAPLVDIISIEGGNFESYYKLRESIKISTTSQLVNVIKDTHLLMKELIGTSTSSPPTSLEDN